MTSNRLSSQPGVLRKRNTRRYLIWLAIPIIKMISLSGCGPREGQEGGACHKSDSCNKYDYCDDNLICVDGTCERNSYRIEAAPGCGYLDSNVSPCATAEITMKCERGARPGPGCVTREVDQDGTTVVCCGYGDTGSDSGASVAN